MPGWVRGAGSEQIFNNANPAYNRELFNEAHDVILAAWTRPGPFRWEGKHRFINPWVTPYQKPRPPIWIPGVLSPETVEWCAQHRYLYLGLGTGLKATVELWNIYGDVAAREGYLAGPENFGYLQHVACAETEAKADAIGRCHLFGGGQVNLLGQEVLPAVREMGKELGLVDPFEREPGSRPYMLGTQREPLVSLRSAANAPS